MGKPLIIVVDDDQNIRVLLEDVLHHWGCEVITATSAKETLEILKDKTPIAVISDIEMPGMNGFELLEQIKRRNPKINVILMSGSTHISEHIQDDPEFRAYEFIHKPFNLQHLKQIILSLPL